MAKAQWALTCSAGSTCAGRTPRWPLSHHTDRVSGDRDHAAKRTEIRGERREQDNHISQRPQEQAPGTGLHRHLMTYPVLQWIGRLCVSILNEFNAYHESRLSNIANVLELMYLIQHQT